MHRIIIAISAALSFIVQAFAQMGPEALIVQFGTSCDTAIATLQLRHLPAQEAVLASHDGELATFRGCLLWDALSLACPAIPAAAKRERISLVVRVTAQNGYTAVVALMEADTSFRDHPALLCWEKNGAPLSEHDGPLQLIVPDDKRHARDVRKVRSLRVTVPQ